MRRATTADMAYLLKAGEDFCRETPYSFDRQSYAQTAWHIINSDDFIVLVDGEPARCHAAAQLAPSMYDVSETIARVFTTWGPGGLKCFRALEKACRDAGASFIIADSFTDDRIASFYRRRGFEQQDKLFMRAA